MARVNCVQNIACFVTQNCMIHVRILRICCMLLHMRHSDRICKVGTVSQRHGMEPRHSTEPVNYAGTVRHL